MLLKLPIRTVGALSRMRALIKKNTYKGALIGRRTLIRRIITVLMSGIGEMQEILQALRS